MKRRVAVVSAVAGATALVVAAPAWAFWTTATTTPVSAAAASLAAPASGSAAAAGSTTMTISVDGGPNNGPTPTGYRVDRVSPDAQPDVCTISSSTGSCTDAGPLSPSTSYTYDVYSLLGDHWVSASALTVRSGTNALPAVTSIARADADNPDLPATVHWTVTFNQSVTGVDATDFQLVTTGDAAATLDSSVTGSGSTYAVSASVTAGSNGATVGLDLVDDDTIVDAGNVPLGGTGTGNGDFTGEVYTFGTAAVAAPVITGLQDATSDTGASATDGITKNQKPAIVGTTLAVSSTTTISVYDDGTTLLGTTSVAPNGTSWSFTPTSPLGDRTHGITATATVNSVTSLASRPKQIVIDTIAPTGLSVSCAFTTGSNYTCSGGAGNATGDSTTVTLVIKHGTTQDLSQDISRSGNTWTYSSQGLSNRTEYIGTLTQAELPGTRLLSTAAGSVDSRRAGSTPCVMRQFVVRVDAVTSPHTLT